MHTPSQNRKKPSSTINDMQILIFVVTMLMLLAMITYGRWETFRSLAVFSVQFEEYMKNTERKTINSGAKSTYDKTVATKKEQEEKDELEQAEGRAKLSFLLFVNKEERSKKQAEYTSLRQIAESLLQVLYGKAPFFEESLPGRLLNRLMEVTDKFPEDKEIKDAKELANLDLGDDELNEIFCRMLRGSAQTLSGNDKDNKLKEYPPLTDFIQVDKKATRIRVYLASKPVLLAIFHDKNLVDTIIKERKNLYNLVKGKDAKMDAKEASGRFQAMFERKTHFNVTVLDFTVTKTDPKKYE